MINNCPIENWPEIISISSKDISVDLDIEKNFGPKTVLTSDQKPDFVWINGESLGDEDPALNNLSDLPVVFIFDIKLLKSLDLSTKRIIFLLDTLKEINEKRELKVYLDNPLDVLSGINYASTFAPVPKYKRITQQIKPSMEFPANRLVDPVNFYPRSFSSWRKKTKLAQ